MDAYLRRLLTGAVAFGCSILIPNLVLTAQRQSTPVVAAPGTLVRWTAPGTTRCTMLGRFWLPLLETCYYPIDLEQRRGLITVGRTKSGRRETARISVEPYEYGTEELQLPDIPQANPSPADLRRDAREGVMLAKVWGRREGPAQFTLPIGPPARPLPIGKNFGVKRVFNGKPAPQRHTGTDYPVPVGSPILAAADGEVVVAEDLFFEGNAVIIDHGNGLMTMYFHLSDIKVDRGQQVKKGHTLGRVGSTGRSTGPHLFFGVRWHNARINPALLLESPDKIPSLDRTLR